LPEEKRQKIKDLLFILEKCNVSESAKRELTVFCDGLPRTYLVSSMSGRYSYAHARAHFQCTTYTTFRSIICPLEVELREWN
jgi:hypothetical protein